MQKFIFFFYLRKPRGVEIRMGIMSPDVRSYSFLCMTFFLSHLRYTMPGPTYMALSFVGALSRGWTWLFWSRNINLNGVVWLYLVAREAGKCWNREIVSFVTRHPCAIVILGESVTETKERMVGDGGPTGHYRFDYQCKMDMCFIFLLSVHQFTLTISAKNI